MSKKFCFPPTLLYNSHASVPNAPVPNQPDPPEPEDELGDDQVVPDTGN